MKSYELLVAVTDQKASDPAEDLRSALKTGDVMVILPEGHRWSETEKTSYLILKMKLNEEQVLKLTQPETRKVELSAEKTKKAELSGRQSSALDEKDRKSRMETARGERVETARGERVETARGERVETVRARAYRLKIETLGFDVEKFWENQTQPYQDKIYDWKLAEKKK
jgi:hypothetical protein